MESEVDGSDDGNLIDILESEFVGSGNGDLVLALDSDVDVLDSDSEGLEGGGIVDGDSSGLDGIVVVGGASAVGFSNSVVLVPLASSAACCEG